MARKLTRIEKSTAIVNDAKVIQWCYVNTDNEFKFMNRIFVIDESVEEYKVHNKAGLVEDYTNEAYMEEILAVIDSEDHLKFYNQNYDAINNKYIKVSE